VKKYLITGACGSMAQSFIKNIYNEEDSFYLLYKEKKPTLIKKKL
jgi:hypothetical protein